MRNIALAWIAGLSLVTRAWSQDQPPAEPAPPLTLYVVGYAHLDTQWRWTYPQTIREFLAHTLHDNFALFAKHPQYVFNFTGSRRYQMFAEYFPAEFAQLKDAVAAGRWFPCGSSVDENDSNIPSAESLVRNVLYGNRFFRRELGVASEEYMLPDCFGFPAALPSVLAHCGITGFSTQKLTWGSVVGIPFNLGVWVGPDGHSVIAALNPGAYDSEVSENLATSETWKKRILADGKQSGVYADFRYYGTGDVGGAPSEDSVALLEKSLDTPGPIQVVAGPADELFRAITPEQREHLPRYEGELELTGHSAGSLTSQAAMKRWNRKNELLADAAERASVLAWWLGGRAYPAHKLEAAWTLVLGSQMHDIISGTALTKGYEYAWNDELLAANQFAAVLQDAAAVVAQELDTRARGVPLVVYNPLSIEREDVVEAQLPLAASAAQSVRVSGPDGKPVAAQIVGVSASSVRVAFLARVPPVGFAVFDAELVGDEAPLAAALRVTERRLENERYVVTLDDDGDVASILDKRAQRELLGAPARLGLHYENPVNWPAWNQDWSDRQKPGSEFVAGPARFRVVERGPARVALEVTREHDGSTFVQRIRLSAGGAGDRVEFDTDIAWTTRERSLRAAFPLAVSNPDATYDMQVGTIERGNAHEKQYEYGFQQWFDLTDAQGDYGVTVACDSKYAADKPDDRTVRLTLLHTPGTRGGYQDQGTQDLGRHHVLYALSGHAGDWRAGKSASEAARLNQPLIPFRAAPHAGPLGKSFALVKVSGGDVAIQALKKAEDGDEIIVRLRELAGRSADGVHVSFAAPIRSAREVDGQERGIGKAEVREGQLVTDMGGYELRAFAVRLGDSPAQAPLAQCTPLHLAFDTDVVSTNAARGDGAMGTSGGTLPAEQLPAKIEAGEVVFELGPTGAGQKNALACRGQELDLPGALALKERVMRAAVPRHPERPRPAEPSRLYLLAAADSGADVQASVEVDGTAVAVRVGPWSGFIGQWDHRLWQGETPELAYGWSNALAGIEPGFVAPDPIAWFSSHHHTPAGDAFYDYCYLYKVAIDLPAGARKIRLPNDEHVMVLAATLVEAACSPLAPAAPLFDTLDDHLQDAPRVVPGAGSFSDSVELRIEPRLYWRDGAIRYTLDGSAPSSTSPVYAGPFFLARATTIQAAVLDAAGRLGPLASARLEIEDVTPPRVEQAALSYASPLVRVRFSEPLDDSALDTRNYTLDPPLEVRAARRGDDARAVILELAAAPEAEREYQLRIAGVKDAAPAHNAIAPVALALRIRGPVFTLAEVTHEQMGTEIRDVPDLPIHARDAWTLNLFVRMDQQPADRTLIAGFGRCEQTENGVARYLAKFPGGVHFWSHNQDLQGRTPFDLGRWQMLSVTYDGQSLRLYKDARKLGERDVTLVDDENAVRFAPLDPWEKQRRFEGEIRRFTIWGEALSEDALRALLDSAAPR